MKDTDAHIGLIQIDQIGTMAAKRKALYPEVEQYDSRPGGIKHFLTGRRYSG